MRANAHSPYMQWAKLHSAAKHNLASSGVASYPIAKLGKLDGLEINGANSYGYAPLVEAIARRFGVPRECVFTTAGTAMANHLALTATAEPGDEILVEQPTYELLLSTAKYLGLKIRRFQRPFSSKFQPDLGDLERNLTPATKLVVLTNMHNPSGVLMSNETVQRIGQLAAKVGARVLVDEVYLEMFYDERPQTAFLLDAKRFIVTSSLTKAYGLSGLRCGWVFAAKQLVERMWAINDLYSATAVFPGEQLSVVAFQNLDPIGQEMKQMLDANRKLLADFYASRRDLEVAVPEHGTVSFARLMNGSVEKLLELLRKNFETTVVPGSFFEAPQHFRVGVGAKTEEVRAALQQLARGLDSFAEAR
ncbi:MAG: pyridoxal phosphate-dependent aminotransferase [Terriglobales bacterium]